MTSFNLIPIVIIVALAVASVAALIAVVTVLYARKNVTDKPGMERVAPSCVLVVTVNGTVFYAHLADNAAARAFTEKLNSEPLALAMGDDGGEKIARLPWDLPTANETITAVPGEILLRRDQRLSLCRSESSGAFTRLARVDSRLDELIAALGQGDATVTMNLEWSE